MRTEDAVRDYFISRSDLSHRTAEDYRRYLALWMEAGAPHALEDVTVRDVERFMYYMQNEYRTRHGGLLSQAGLRNCWCAIRSFWRWAADTHGVPNVALGLRMPKVPVPDVVPLTRDQIQALLRACYYTRITEYERARPHPNRRPEAERDAAIVLLLLDTGIRVSELVHLDVGDLDLLQREVAVRARGTGTKSRPRHIPFTRDTATVLLRWFSQRRDSGDETLDLEGQLPADAPAFVLLRSNAGRRINRRAVGHVLTRLGKRAGIADVHPHRLRHTFAIEYLRGGGDPWTLQDLLGHSSMEMVRRYLALAKQDYRRTHERASAVGRWRLYIPR